MESIKRSFQKTKIKHHLFATNRPMNNRLANLVKMSKWNNTGSNVSEVLYNILEKAKYYKAVHETKHYSPQIRKNAALKMMSLTNDAAIVLDPLGHRPPANKYKGFMQRYGKYLDYARKKTILTKAPYKKTSAANYAKRFPEKLERAMSLKPHEILSQFFFPKGPKPVEYLGGGVDGKVYLTNDGRVMKFLLGSEPQEYTALRNLQSTGLVPSFRNGNGKVLRLFPTQKNAAQKMFGNTSSQMTAFIMGRVGGSRSMTLRKYVRTYPSANRENIAQRLRSIVNALGLKGISHGNMHDENIIVEVDSNGRIRRMWLIDFGRSNKITTTARNMLMATRVYLESRGIKPRLYPTRGLYGNTTNVPLAGKDQNSRIDPHMFMALTGKEYTRANEAQIQNYRKLIAGMKNRLVTTPTRRAKSASPSIRSTSGTPRGSPKSTRASPRR